MLIVFRIAAQSRHRDMHNLGPTRVVSRKAGNVVFCSK